MTDTTAVPYDRDGDGEVVDRQAGQSHDKAAGPLEGSPGVARLRRKVLAAAARCRIVAAVTGAAVAVAVLAATACGESQAVDKTVAVTEVPAAVTRDPIPATTDALTTAPTAAATTAPMAAARAVAKEVVKEVPAETVVMKEVARAVAVEKVVAAEAPAERVVERVVSGESAAATRPSRPVDLTAGEVDDNQRWTEYLQYRDEYRGPRIHDV